MMQSRARCFLLGCFLLLTEAACLAAILGTNKSHLRANCDKSPHRTSYGKNSCRCVGVDNLKGYYAAQVNFHHVQYSAETGASCDAWDQGSHPECHGSVPPQWCSQQWCYVDPCSCDLDVPPKRTVTGVEYQGQPAHWSYKTCGSTDFFSQENKEACIMQTSEGECNSKSKCAWDGKKCGDGAVVKSCKEAAAKDESVHGKEDCRCIGLGGKDIGKTFLHINDKDLVQYPANVGATCQAWEMDAHPACLQDGEKPSWCSNKWCMVDPCKCKTKTPPLTVMQANQHMRFQGKTAYWSYETCGSADTWSSSHAGKYCVSQKSEAACSELSKCAWNGRACLGKALVEICAKQEESGVLGMESPFESNSLALHPEKVLLGMMVVFAIAYSQQ